MGGVLVVCRDVTSEHAAREELKLINEELKHRVKNTLAVLSAVAAQTFRDVSSRVDLQKFQGRLSAFGRAHDVLTSANWAEAPIQDVIKTALAPYNTGESRFTIQGPSLLVKSRQALSLSLAIHELATNALKYGALTVPGGCVSITWDAQDISGASQFVFTWREVHGPPARQPSTSGFGSTLISRVLKDDFQGSVELSYETTGFVCRLIAPLAGLAAPVYELPPPIETE